MLGFKYSDFAFICATLLLAATCILGQQLQYRKPWPTYSLQNMPQTRFTCHDKILGGYYADAETQCQMFHVCVKVAGVGVQDFRFLCPNGTAFDQEAQICADWGDVDCEASVLYYGSDNFDLYRLGSGFESKRAPLAEEEESTFHLQRAESADIRRSKETRVDQQSRPDQPPNYTKRFEATPRNAFNSFANSNGNSHSLSHNNNQNQRNSDSQTPSDARPAGDVPKRPIVNYYTPTSSTTPSSYSSSTTSTTTERYSNDESKLEYDDIFKGSHSSHFFANRNGGREDDFVDHPSKSKYNDFTEYNNNKKSTITSTTGKTRAPQPTRSKRIQIVSSTSSGSSSSSAAPTKSPTPPTPKFNKKITLFAAYNTTKLEQPKPHTSPATSVAVIGGSSTTRPSYITVNRFNLNGNDYHTQERIEPTTYNPAYNLYRLKSTTPKYTDLSRDIGPVRGKATSSPTALPYESTKGYNKPTATARKAQKLERTQQKLAARGNATTFVSPNELTDFAKVKPLQQAPQPFQAPQTTRISISTSNEPQYYRVRNGGEQPQRVGRLDPAPFSGATRQRSTATTASTSKPSTSVNPELRPRGFANRGSINYKATTQQGGAEIYAATTSSTKKFSTLVPKDQYSAYTPTTFKPTTFKPTSFQKSYDNFHYNVQQQPTVRSSSRQPNFEPSSTAVPNTANPYYNADEDDGQYHPELYEVDFPRNRFNLQRSSTGTASTTTTTTTSTPRPYNAYNTFDNPQKHLQTQQQSAFRKQAVEQAVPVDLNDEDELFKTAHSLNFGAASINKLRADIFKAEKNSQQYNSQYSPSLEQSTSTSGTSPKPSTTTPRPTTSTTYRTTTPSTTYDYLTYSTTASTQRAYSSSAAVPSITTAAPTRRTTTYGTTAAPPPPPPPMSKSSKPSKHGKLAGKGKSKKSKPASKRPPHADEDTSYDYAYYDTDTLSESPQQYPDYEIAEFVKTRKN